MAQLFEYAVFLDEKKDKDGEVVEKAEVLVPITEMLAKDAGQVQLAAAMAIGEEHKDRLDRIKVVVRPFG